MQRGGAPGIDEIVSFSKMNRCPSAVTLKLREGSVEQAYNMLRSFESEETKELKFMIEQYVFSAKFNKKLVTRLR